MGAPSGTFTSSTAPVNLVRNRPWEIGCVWQTSPGNVPINIFGYQITAEIVFGGCLSLVPTITIVDAARGSFQISLTEEQTPTIHATDLATLGITLVDTFGNTSDFGVQLNVQTPIDP